MGKIIDFTAHIASLKRHHGINDNEYDAALSDWLASNGWLETDVFYQDGRLYTTEEFLAENSERIETHARYYHLSNEEKNRLLYRQLKGFAPETSRLFGLYAKDRKLEEETVYILLGFFCYYLPGELHESTDREVRTLMENGYDSLSKVYGDILADFINWVKTKIKTTYYNSFFMQSYGDKESESAAYPEGKFLLFIYYMFDPGYIEENDMYGQAARSKNYADTWLFLALHGVCALRNTDLVRLPHPRLSIPPDDVLKQVEEGTFSEADAKACLYSILYTLAVTKNVPHKTKETSGVPDIKLEIPQSLETHMGTLFAVAEAHNQLLGNDPNKPLIRVISEFRRIQKYMGEEIGELFIEADFHSRSANKSFLQMIYIMTDNVNNTDDELRVKGYILAALARSHKGSYGEFAQTTSIYLKDAKMSGFSPEFVARELMERGVLSCIADMLLKMTYGDAYKHLSTTCQTKAIRALNVTPLDVENVISATQRAQRQALVIARDIYTNNTRENILKILHKLGNGEAASKQDHCLCILTAMNKPCAYSERYHMCIGCQYEISTKATVLMLIFEYKRLQKEYKATSDQLMKDKNRDLANTVVVPAIEDLLDVMKEKYGEGSVTELEEIIEKVEKNGY